jgi:hypothetical protein
MSLGITRYSLSEAEGKSCVKQEEILQWIDDGLIRIVNGNHSEVRINIVDLNLKVEEMTGI